MRISLTPFNSPDLYSFLSNGTLSGFGKVDLTSNLYVFVVHMTYCIPVALYTPKLLVK